MTHKNFRRKKNQFSRGMKIIQFFGQIPSLFYKKASSFVNYIIFSSLGKNFKTLDGHFLWQFTPFFQTKICLLSGKYWKTDWKAYLIQKYVSKFELFLQKYVIFCKKPQKYTNINTISIRVVDSGSKALISIMKHFYKNKK